MLSYLLGGNRLQMSRQTILISTLDARCPQGLVLFPILFLVFINDLPVGVIGQNTTVDIFADDTSMGSSAPTSKLDTLRSNLNTSLQQLDSWSANNRVWLNTSQTISTLIASKRLRNYLTQDDKLLNIKLNNSTVEQVFTWLNLLWESLCCHERWLRPLYCTLVLNIFISFSCLLYVVELLFSTSFSLAFYFYRGPQVCQLLTVKCFTLRK